MLQGSFSPRAGLADAMRLIYTQRLSGILVIQQDSRKRKLYFEKGSFVFAETNEPGWRLGELLVSHGILGAEDLEDVLTLTGPGKRTGQVLRELNLITEEQLADVVRYQVLESVYPVFGTPHGEYRFEAQESPAPADIALALSTANVVMEGVRRIQDPELVRTALGATNKVVVLGSNPLLRFQSIFLKPKEGFILSRIDGVLTIDQVCSISPVPEDETLSCLYGLFAAGILELRAPEEQAATEAAEDQDIAGFFTEFGGVEEVIEAASTEPTVTRELTAEERKEREELEVLHGRLDEVECHELLGVEVTADTSEVRKAYYRLAKRYHPDRHHKGHLAELHDKLESIFVRINEAYDAMREGKYKRSAKKSPAGSQQAKDEPTEADAASDGKARTAAAEDSYRHGRQLLEEGDYYGAIQSFRRAVQLNEDNADYHSYLGRVLAKNPKWRKDAEKHLLKAIEMHPAIAENYAQLGQLYAAAGLVTKAQRFYDEALKWEPGNETALAGRGVLDGKGEKGKLSGAFRSFFAEKRK